MKKLWIYVPARLCLIYILFISSVSFPENKLTETGEKNSGGSIYTIPVDSSLSDTVNISAIVKSQFEAAQAGIIKSSIISNGDVRPEKAPDKLVPVKPNFNGTRSTVIEYLVFTLQDFYKAHGKVVIFIGLSVLVFGFVFGRRYLKFSGSKSIKNMKKAINIIRDEKPVSLKNKKLHLLRKKLIDSAGIYSMTDGMVSGKAKELNLGKGELMLAAKIKSVQLSRILK